ncbi:MAG: TPM domain-containing protein [Proteobacteria bacterium]|nr:TPM domain-containing protein [Pseudomonadota bacterium]
MGVAHAIDVPYLTGRVVDDAEILKPATRDAIAATLKAHEDKTGDQVAVLTVRSLDGNSIEDYANTVFNAWKLGQKGKDNGVLVVVAPAEHRMRIEVGYGLEGTLPDAIAARIIRDRMTPAFKANDFDRGIADGASAIVAVLEGHADALPPATAAAASPSVHRSNSLDDAHNAMPWTTRILIGCFIFGIIGLFTVVGVMTPGSGWFLYLFLIPFWAMFPVIVLGTRGALVLLATYVVGFPIAKLIVRSQPWYTKAAAELKSTGRANVGGWVITSGGSSSGGSSDGGGFSGGGGSSGGGGASGSW